MGVRAGNGVTSKERNGILENPAGWEGLTPGTQLPMVFPQRLRAQQRTRSAVCTVLSSALALLCGAKGCRAVIKAAPAPCLPFSLPSSAIPSARAEGNGRLLPVKAPSSGAGNFWCRKRSFLGRTTAVPLEFCLEVLLMRGKIRARFAIPVLRGWECGDGMGGSGWVWGLRGLRGLSCVPPFPSPLEATCGGRDEQAGEGV